MNIVRTIATALLMFCFIPVPCSAEPKLHVGVIVPLTGGLASSGASVRNAVLLAQQLYDTRGLVHFTFEDDEFQPKNSVSIAKRFIEEKKDAIIIFGTPTAFAVVPVTEAAGMPLAAITIVDRVVEGKQFAVRHFVAWQEENRRVVDEVRARGYRRIAVVTTINDASLALRDGFVKEAPAEIVLNEEFKPGDLDFRTVAAKIRHLNVDAVYNLLFSPQASSFTRSLREMHCSAPIFAVHNIEDPKEIAAAQGGLDGAWFVSGDESHAQRYLAAYKERFDADPAMGWANAFDYAKMIIEAAEHGVPILNHMKSLTAFEGAFGTYGAQPGNSFNLKATVKVVRGSGWEILGQ